MKKIAEILLFIYLVLFPFGQLVRLPLKLGGIPEVNFYLTDIIVGLLGGIGVIRAIGAVREKKYKLPVLAKPMIIFLGVTALSLVVNIPFFQEGEILVGGLYWLRLAAYFGFYLLIYLSDWSNLSDLLLVCGGAVAFFGLGQYFLWPDLNAFKYVGWDPHYYRLAGTFLDPNFTGIILVLSLILLLDLFKKKKVTFYFLLFTFYFSLALTYSRASWLAFLGGMGSWFCLKWGKKGIRAIIFIIFITVITIIILPRGKGGEGVKLERTSSVFSRIGSWRQALIIAKDHPILGVGFNTYRYVQKKYGFLGEDWQTSHAGGGADNSLLFVLATSGGLGLLGLLGLLGKILLVSFKKSRLVFASLIAVLFHSFFNNTLFYPWVMGWLAIILGRL